jgi:hypothetical protein
MAYGKKDKSKDKNLVKPPIKRTPTKKIGMATKSKKYDPNAPFIKGETAGMTKGQARASIKALYKSTAAKAMDRKDVRSAKAKASVTMKAKKK